MNQADRDRILQLVAYVKALYHSDYRKLAPMSDPLIKAHALCNDVIASIDSVATPGWTQEKPRREGWYWAERNIAGLPRVTMVFVTRITGDYTHVWDPNARKEHGVSDFDWWQGPLYCSPLPKEVTL